MKCKIKGTITFIGEREEKGNGFYKRGVVINGKEDEYDGEPNDYYMDAIKEKSDNLAQYQKVGDKVEATFYVNCRQYGNEGKWFTGLSLTYIENLDSSSSQSQTSSSPSRTIEPANVDDDLPF